MPGREPICTNCPVCRQPLEVAYEDGFSALECPNCHSQFELHKELLRKEEHEARRQREEAEATRQHILVLRRAEEENQQLQRRAHYQAVLAGKVFDPDLLVEELKNDWVELQRVGLTRAHIRQGFKAASPAAGVGAWWLGAPPWIAVLIGISTYLASGPAGEGYVEIKFQEWRAKWARILANCSAAQLHELSETLGVRYPMVYGSMSGMGQLPSPQE